jgi:hypothetical protein
MLQRLDAGKDWGWQWVFPVTSHYTNCTPERNANTNCTNLCYQKAVEEAGCIKFSQTVFYGASGREECLTTV